MVPGLEVSVRRRVAPLVTLGRVHGGQITAPPPRQAWLFWGLLAIGCTGVGLVTVWLSETLPAQDGGFLYEFIIFAALGALAVGTYAVWPSRWNIYAHTQLGFAITAYLIPLFFQPSLELYPSATVRSYALIMAIGAAAFLAGLFLGRRLYLRSAVARRLQTRPLFPSTLPPRFFTFVALLASTALIGLWVSLAIAGVIPLFAADPYAAKYFRAEYEGAYLPIAALFRTSYAVFTVLVPVLFVVWFATRRSLFLVLGLGAVVTMIATLRRSDASLGLLLFLGLVFAQRGRSMLPYLVLVCGAYALASVFYAVLFGLGLQDFASIPALVETQSFFAQVASSAPDVSDHLRFLNAYLHNPEPTYGRTFLGGMFPNHYKWNPAIWSLSIVNPGANASSLVTGGLRLPTPIWGFTAFGWGGAVVVPFLAGLAGGAAASLARSQAGKGPFLQSAMVVIAYFTVGVAAMNFVMFLSSTAVAVALVVLLTGIARAKRAGGASVVPASPV